MNQDHPVGSFGLQLLLNTPFSDEEVIVLVPPASVFPRRALQYFVGPGVLPEAI